MLPFTPLSLVIAVATAGFLVFNFPQAHKTHYYQRLVQLGWGHKKTVLWEYALMIACGLSVVWAVRQPVLQQWLVMGFWAVCYASLVMFVHALEKRGSS